MHPQIKHLRELILASDGSEAAQNNIMKALAKVERTLEITNFKVQRTLQNKTIITNILNQTISELSEKKATLEQQKTIIEERSKFKEQLFANVSHELRTPLNGILGMSHLLGDTPLEQQQRRYVEVIKSSADNLIVIINDILNLSRINSGKVNILLQPFGTQTFFNDLYGLLNVKAEEKKLQLNFNVATNIPPYLVGDRTRVYQILLNLLNNAIKFTHRGFVTLTVTIEAATYTDKYIRLVCEIADTGIGIAKDKYDAIFESFTQVYEQGHVYEGAGLGLNIVKNLLDLMNGQVTVQSKVNRGTVFIIKIPFEVADAEVVANYKYEQNRITTIPVSWQHKKLLYIEDNEANILYAKGIIKRWKMQIDIAENLAEATHKIKARRYDCILSDMILPDGNGVVYMAQMRADETSPNQHVPVIILTASANEKGEEEARKWNLEGYLAKPFTPRQLLEQLSKVFGTQIETTEKIPPTITTAPDFSGEIPCNKPYLQRLAQKVNGNKQYMIEMIDIFLQQIPIALQNMEKGILEDDWKSVHFEVHKIKSTINIVGLDYLEPIILEINQYTSKSECLEQVPALFEQFKQRAIIDVKKILEERKKLTFVG